MAWIAFRDLDGCDGMEGNVGILCKTWMSNTDHAPTSCHACPTSPFYISQTKVDEQGLYCWLVKICLKNCTRFGALYLLNGFRFLFLCGPLLCGDSDHLLWSVFQSSLYPLQITLQWTFCVGSFHVLHHDTCLSDLCVLIILLKSFLRMFSIFFDLQFEGFIILTFYIRECS